ncbi:hydrogen peroxide-inducible genes activator [Arcticibacter eurypsychrophilus]|uniref:hydrogen peroxide-inducible genes activator n=1 Tax=Arcticibacter eurypsychrophilus TaxID=1434752 RepID=UPI00084D8829|nr:hydrogen peroxide-inducible genes activator [Arcticibacter eurypsychrophilus]
MTLVQLEYVVAVDTFRNFVQAADKCCVTQPTLSMQIQKLEDNLGVILFDRSKQPVVPTEIGVQVIEQARLVLAEADNLNEIIHSFKKEISGTLKIGVIPTVAPYLLPKIILSFTSKYPKVQLLIWEFTTEQIVQKLKVGLLDCGIVSTPLDDKSLNALPLFYEPFALYASKDNPVLKRKSIVAENIEIKDLWLLNEGHCMRNQVLNLCSKKAELNKLKLFEYNTGSVETLKRMVDLNSGITILPELSLSDLSKEQLKRVRRFKDPVPAREISIITHRNFLKRSIITALEKEILESLPDEMRSSTKKEILEGFM